MVDCQNYKFNLNNLFPIYLYFNNKYETENIMTNKEEYIYQNIIEIYFNYLINCNCNNN